MSLNSCSASSGEGFVSAITVGVRVMQCVRSGMMNLLDYGYASADLARLIIVSPVLRGSRKAELVPTNLRT